MRRPCPAKLGDLTKSGLLYEANYNEWITRMDVILRTHELLRYVCAEHDGSSEERDDSGREGCSWNVKERCDYLADAKHYEKALGLINSQLSPTFQRRMLHFRDQLSQTDCPFSELRMIAQPFKRLWDLPLEFRNNVYEYALELQERPITITTGLKQDALYHWDDYKSAWPATAQVCQQMRAEVLPIFYARNSFLIRAKPLVLVGRPVERLHMEETFQPRLEQIVGDNTKHLRHVVLTDKNAHGETIRFEFRFSSSEGFEWSSSKESTADVNRKLGFTMREAKIIAKLMRVEGESIVMAMFAAKNLLRCPQGKTEK
ncbi:Hypothetical predicted protein [Lecanosticta acicola]|uniref:Uncharacterized protein n=1 Tax=Lecanosticta acicola TaxID=111012 RepID=A0AAI9ECR6_9PEZI|nr:Hypothetical predicted protein [Lecanosticta acicola]